MPETGSSAALAREWREHVLMKLDRIEQVASATSATVQVLGTRQDLLEQRVVAIEKRMQGDADESGAGEAGLPAGTLTQLLGQVNLNWKIIYMLAATLYILVQLSGHGLSLH